MVALVPASLKTHRRDVLQARNEIIDLDSLTRNFGMNVYPFLPNVHLM